MKDWLPMVISILALLFSVYATYIKDLKKNSSLKYYESWDIHTPPTPSELDISKKENRIAEILSESIRKVSTWLIYTITITNVGNKDSENLKMSINKLDDLSIFDDFSMEIRHNPLLFTKAYLLWEPLTHEKPQLEKGVHHGRTASHPAAPVQIPACGTTAPGSSKSLASHLATFGRYSEAVADVWSLELEDLYQLGKAFPVVAPALTAPVHQPVEHEFIWTR